MSGEIPGLYFKSYEDLEVNIVVRLPFRFYFSVFDLTQSSHSFTSNPLSLSKIIICWSDTSRCCVVQWFVVL